MTYIDVIKKLLNKAGDELTYPVNISVHFFSANHIQFELDDGRNINEIFKDKIKNCNHIGIQWLDNQNKINSIRLDDYGVTKSCISSGELTKESFNNEQFTVIGKDNKFRLLLYPLEENIEIEENGFVKEKILEHEKGVYELEKIVLPKFEDYKYKNLYLYYKEEEFINAILLEFILRHINHNNLAPDKIEIYITEEENMTEEELELKEHLEFQKIENEINTKLINIFGLSYDEINKLKLIYNKDYVESLAENNIVMELKSTPPPFKNIEINLMHSTEKLIQQIGMLKDNFDRETKSCLNLKERVSKEYLVKATEVLEKFPKSFEKKKDDLIKALFIFDYIQAKKLYIDHLNNEVIEENEIKIKEIETKYKNLLNCKENELERYEKDALNIQEEYNDLSDDEKNEFKGKIKSNNKIIDELKKEIKSLVNNEKKELSKNKKDLKMDLISYPKMNQMHEESIFLEIEELISEQAGQSKKIHSHIHKFLESKI